MKGLHKNSLRKGDNPHQWMIDDARQKVIRQIRAEVERLENYYTSVEWYVEALLSFLDTFGTTEKSSAVEQPVQGTTPIVPQPEEKNIPINIADLPSEEETPQEKILFKHVNFAKEQPVCKELNEEIKSFWDYFYGKDRRVTRAINIYDFANLARHFAQWQKEQMMKEAVVCDAEVCKLSDRVWVTPFDKDKLHKDTYERFKAGDKVKLIIIKED